MPQLALKRAFVSCVLVWKEFYDSDGIFNFSQFGTMLQEHFHGLLRGMANGNDTLENTIRCIVRSNSIADIQNKLKNPCQKKTRFSVGGTHYDSNIHKEEYIPDLTPKFIIERLQQMSIYGNYKEFKDLFLITFFAWIENVSRSSLRITCTDKHFHYGRRIISREITNSQESDIISSDQER